MFFGPQKVLAHGQCASRDYSRKKVILSTAVVAARAQATDADSAFHLCLGREPLRRLLVISKLDSSQS
jgi:hypothetical protein